MDVLEYSVLAQLQLEADLHDEKSNSVSIPMKRKCCILLFRMH
jgi:hypothetical protein